ncbi:MAG: C1 family peptidase [Lachnospiraceae bacterium]|nr:C1 family peptidase [Lachnospiraceae bacterium]
MKIQPKLIHAKKYRILQAVVITMLIVITFIGCAQNSITYKYNNSDDGSGISISKSVYTDNELRLYIKGLSDDEPKVCAYDSKFKVITEDFTTEYKNNVLSIKGSNASRISGLYIEGKWNRYHIRYLDSDEYALMYEVEATEIGWELCGDKEKYYTSGELADQQAKKDEALAIQEENFNLLEGVWRCQNDPSLYMEFYKDSDGKKKMEWCEKNVYGENETMGMRIAVIDIVKHDKGISLDIKDDPYYGMMLSYAMSEDKTEIIEYKYNAEDNVYVKETEENAIDSSQHEYMPNKNDGSYYSIIEDNCPLDVKTQQSGTCWTCAITSSMEGSYYKNNNKKISFDATDLCLKIYDDDKLDGWFVHRDKLDYGGWDWLACDYLPNGYDGYYLKDAWRYDDENSRDDLKEGIRNHGPISVAVCDNTSYKRFYDGYFTMNDDNPDHLDHAVIIIGWDDNFPKDYFNRPAKNDGAWICQNSKSKGWGNDGLYYISYESLIDENVIFNVSTEYADVAYYDCGNEKQISTGDTCSTANVFSKKGTLVAIGTYTNSDYQNYKIEILDGKFGEPLITMDGVSDIKGYHVTNLPEPIDVEDYTVVITYEGLAPVEGESYVIDDLVEYVASSSKNQSFVLIGDEWVDMASSDIKERIGIDFMPNNACIKALYR